MRARWILILALLMAGMLIAGCTGGEKTYRVKPSGVDDTAAIQAAINQALAEGPGGVIQFTKGEYYLSGPVLALNFSGALRGKGPEQTVLHLVSDTPLAPWTGSDIAEPGVLFAFEYDNAAPVSLTIQDMGLSLVGRLPANQQDESRTSPLQPFWVSGVGGTRPVSTTFTNLALRGDPATTAEGNRNIDNAVTLLNLSGKHTLSHAVLENIDGAVFRLEGVADASVTLGGAESEDLVTLTNVGYGVLARKGIDNVQVEAAHVNATGMHLLLGIYRPDASRIHISNAVVGGGGLWAGIWTHDAELGRGELMDQPYTLLVENSDLESLGIYDMGESAIVIRNNTFRGMGIYECGPVWLCGTTNAQITGNTFLGYGPGAIHASMGNCGDADTATIISDNDFSQWVQDGGEFEPDWHGQAPIWLGVRTSGITVSGCGDPKVVVYDETDRINTPEYDGKNIIEGLSTAQSGG